MVLGIETNLLYDIIIKKVNPILNDKTTRPQLRYERDGSANGYCYGSAKGDACATPGTSSNGAADADIISTLVDVRFTYPQI